MLKLQKSLYPNGNPLFESCTGHRTKWIGEDRVKMK